MNSVVERRVSRESLLHSLYEAAELEHCLMCTYLYAAFSLKDGEAEGLSAKQAAAVASWRRTLIAIAVEEMGHLTAVWNITAALGGAPRFGRANFPLDPGGLPASVVVKLTPFNMETLQHFTFLERPHGSNEPDGDGFAPDRTYRRGQPGARLTPMGMEYETVGVFYEALSQNLRDFVARVGEDAAFSGNPGLQLSPDEVMLAGAKRVICIKTALAAFDAIVVQGEGAPTDATGSHYQKYAAMRAEYRDLLREDPAFVPAHRAATNPVLRRPPRPEGRVWLEDPAAIATVDVANAAYALMLRLMAYSYAVPGPSNEKSLVVDLAVGLMRAMTPLGELAARLPAGESNPDCHAGMSFTALRDAAPLLPGASARQFVDERFAELSEAAQWLQASGDPRAIAGATSLTALSARGRRELARLATVTATPAANANAPAIAPVSATPIVPVATASHTENGVEIVPGKHLTLLYEGKLCIHSRFCVTWGPKVFLANVQGPWIHPDEMSVDQVTELAHVCPSGAIRYRRTDGGPDEPAPPVNLMAVREAGPYAFRGALELDGKAAGFRATLCRCGASKNKPFCDGSHHEVNFAATGEPPTGKTDMLPVRDGRLSVDPEPNGPLQVRGNLEITSGTGRIVSRLTSARLCRCGGSATKPFCDGTHARIGFVSS